MAHLAVHQYVGFLQSNGHIVPSASAARGSEQRRRQTNTVLREVRHCMPRPEAETPHGRAGATTTPRPVALARPRGAHEPPSSAPASSPAPFTPLPEGVQSTAQGRATVVVGASGQAGQPTSLANRVSLKVRQYDPSTHFPIFRYTLSSKSCQSRSKISKDFRWSLSRQDELYTTA
jgi:hypothetical protein